MTLPQDILGVEIAKGWIDSFTLSSRKHERIPTTKPALARFARAAKGNLVVVEGEALAAIGSRPGRNGGYERPLTEVLGRAQVDCALVNPRQAREHARATGRLAKTDRVDAEVLARMGRALELAPTPAEDPDHTRLSGLVARRDDLVATVRAERNRAAAARDPWLARGAEGLPDVLQAHLKAVEDVIAALIGSRVRLAAEAHRLRSVPALSAVLIARLPELGHLDHRKIPSPAGLARRTSASGLHRGKRRTRGGRADVRRALYLAAFIASRHDPALQAFRQRLQDAGKPVKLAKSACAGKLLTILNAMAGNALDYRTQTA